jgi:hypothetical protein
MTVEESIEAREAMMSQVRPVAALLNITLELDHLWNDQILMVYTRKDPVRVNLIREVPARSAEHLQKEVVKFWHFCQEKY